MDLPKRIITTFYPIVGGVEKQALMQSRSLQERDFEVTISIFCHVRTRLSGEEIETIPVILVDGILLSGREKSHPVLQ